MWVGTRRGRIAALALLLAVCGCAHLERARDEIATAWRPPTGAETAVLVASEAATAADVWITMDLPNHPGLSERNALLGFNPTRPRLLGLGAAAMLGEAATWYLLPPPWRTVFAGGVGVIEIGVTASNYSLGLRWRL